MITKHLRAILLVMFILWAASADARNLIVGGDQSIKSGIEHLYHQITTAGTADSIVRSTLVAWLAERGYLDAVYSNDSGRTTITTGPMVQLHAISIQGRSNTPQLFDRPFTPVNLEAILESILQPLRDSGYVYGRVSVKTIERSGNAVTVSVSVATGPMVKAKELSLVGLERTRPELVERWLRFDSGSVITDELLRSLSDRAGSIPFAEFKGPIAVKPLAGYNEAVLQLNFREKRQFLIDGGAGYDPEQSNGLVWSLNLRLQNLFGTGRDISVLSARRQTGNNLLDIAYNQPLFIFGIGDAHGRIMTRNFQNQFYEFTASAGLTSAIQPNQIFGLDLGWKRVDPEIGLSYRGYEATVKYSLGRPDQSGTRVREFRLSSSIGYLFRRYNPDSLGSGSTYNDTRAELEASYGQPLWKGWSAWGRINYRGIESNEDSLPASELYFIGGPGTLRGFRTDQFVAERAVVGTIEPRLSFSGGYAFGFVDAGYLNLGKTAGTGDRELSKFGYGIGATISDQNRSVSISLGWNRELSLDQPQLAIKLTSVL